MTDEILGKQNSLFRSGPDWNSDENRFPIGSISAALWFRVPPGEGEWAQAHFPKQRLACA